MEGFITDVFAGSLDDESKIGKVSADSNSIYYIYVVSKGTYIDLADAQSKLAGTSLTYQLAEPKTIELPNITPLTAYPNGTIMIEPYIKAPFLYEGGITLPYPVINIDKIKDMQGNEIDEADITLSSDGLIVTITGATENHSYTVYAPIRPEESTIPTTVAKYVMNKDAEDEQQNKSICQLSDNIIDLQDQVAMLIVMQTQ